MVLAPTVAIPENYENLGVLGERSDPLLDRTVLLITTGSRTSNSGKTNFLDLEEISSSKANNPLRNNMFIELKKKK